jgi:hypothetical protein
MQTFAQISYGLDVSGMFGLRAVRQIKPGHIHAGPD